MRRLLVVVGLVALVTLLACAAWARERRMVTVKPQPATRKGNVVLRHVQTIVDHDTDTVYLRIQDVATLMQRSITYTLDEHGKPTGEITIQPAPKQKGR